MVIGSLVRVTLDAEPAGECLKQAWVLRSMGFVAFDAAVARPSGHGIVLVHERPGFLGVARNAFVLEGRDLLLGTVVGV